MKKLIELNEKLEKAQDALANEISKKWPTGSEIYFNVRYYQITPSSGIVLGADRYKYAGYLRVKMYSRKQDVKSIYFAHIIDD